MKREEADLHGSVHALGVEPLLALVAGHKVARRGRVVRLAAQAVQLSGLPLLVRLPCVLFITLCLLRLLPRRLSGSSHMLLSAKLPCEHAMGPRHFEH